MLSLSASLTMSISLLKALPVNLISKDTHLVFSISITITAFKRRRLIRDDGWLTCLTFEGIPKEYYRVMALD